MWNALLKNHLNSALLISSFSTLGIGPLHDPVTWHGINYTGTQMTQWDIQNKGKSGWTGTSSFVLEVPLRHLRPSVIYSVPCDRIVQRAYYNSLFFHRTKTTTCHVKQQKPHSRIYITGALSTLDTGEI